MKGIFFGKLPENELFLDENEVAARLKTARGYSSDLILSCEKNLRSQLDCGYCGILTDLSFPSENTVDLGFAAVSSKNLYKNLFGCKSAYVFAVTLGHGVDRLLKKLTFTSLSEHFITDGLASAFAEAACDKTDFLLSQGRGNRRFSPGYGDLPLGVQPALLQAIKADKYLGITLSEALLMTPTKSITAIKGIEQ